MVLGGVCGGLSIIGMRVETCLVLTRRTLKRITSMLIWTARKLVLIPSMDLEQPREMRRSTAKSAFCHFGKKLIFAPWHHVFCLRRFPSES